ncbi:MAG TPA: Hsp20/alpha crystallin family protein [Arthrobacter sp.]|nr:Hsp20/alpha crystallin family protein [Arthrobacter sp.]
MHDNPSTELARNSNSFLPVNLFDFPSFGFLEAAQRFLDTPVRASMKCEEFVDSDQLVVRAELPGVDPESGIKVSVSDGVLTIQATREESKEEKNPDSYRSEFSYGELRRSLALPQDARADGITASYKDGVLEVRVPAPERPAISPTTIPVSRS